MLLFGNYSEGLFVYSLVLLNIGGGIYCSFEIVLNYFLFLFCNLMIVELYGLVMSGLLFLEVYM